ncbi:MAG: carbon-nitrogen hydrolase, partial [Candidatus Dadabacteria bacterium]|nr:carbon-nitrogen hydrolase [Candidatus Dadabacteria bacterium]
MSAFKVALVQTRVHKDREENLKKAILNVEKASALGADIVCLPELFLTRYFCQSEDTSCFDLAEPIPGPATNRFCGEAKKRRVFIVCPLFEKRASGVYHNSLVLISPEGEIRGIYRKMHIPDDLGYFEKFYFAPGDTGFSCFETGFAKIGTLICWDQWYPEAARITSLKGADMIFYPTAIGWRTDEDERSKNTQLEAWKTAQRAHAISNGIYVAAVNRVGFEELGKTGEGIDFWGSSFVCDPEGVVISEASGEKEEIILADIDLRK